MLAYASHADQKYTHVRQPIRRQCFHFSGMIGGASFTPGTLGGGSLYGSNQGSGYHATAPAEKPLKVNDLSKL